MDADGVNVRHLKSPHFSVQPRWSPDGKQILYSVGDMLDSSALEINDTHVAPLA